jgi:glycerol-3-phosphate acyltransferase PlsY
VTLHIGQVVLVILAYVAGSMPWGYWIVRVTRGQDIRAMGSGNTGATNVWRSFGPRLGLITAILDMLKGFVPALVGHLLYDDATGVAAGLAAVIGHTFPIFLGLGGGKGVATGTGACTALLPVGGLVALATWLTVLWLFRYVSLASMAGAIAFAATAVILHPSWATTGFCLLAATIVIVRHRSNIGRLRCGQEPRVMSFGRGRA